MEDTSKVKIYYNTEKSSSKRMLVALSVQQIVGFLPLIVMPLMIVLQAFSQTQHLYHCLALGMFGCAISALLQVGRFRYLGAGIFGPRTPNPAYLSAAIYAVNKGGIALLSGMTFFAGLAQIAFTYMIETLKRFLPPELGFIVIAVIGFNLGIMGITKFASLSVDTKAGFVQLIIGVSSLITMYTLYVFSKGLLKVFALLLGIILAYVLTLSFGLMNAEHIAQIKHAPWFLIPNRPHIHFVLARI